MRDILFKAKRKDNGKWITGNLIHDIFFENDETDIFYILNVDDVDYCSFEDLTDYQGYYEVFPETLCQYTGMDDKNGNRIWENDIVERPKGKFKYPNAQVIWYQPDLCFYFVDIESWHEAIYQNDKDNIEAIGNVFDNPELLEVEE